MKIQAYKGDIGQEYVNPFKDKNIYPFNMIGRVIVNKNTGDIIYRLNENDSNLDINRYLVTIDNSIHEVMVYFPAFYAKRDWTGDVCKDSMLTEIPNSIEKEGYRVMDCFIREDGSIRPYVLVGAFLASEIAGQLRSVAGTKPTVSKTIANFRDLARQGRNNKWNILDFNTLTMLQFLYKIAFGDTNSQKIIGNGWTNKTEAPINGATMKLGNRSGYLDFMTDSPDKPDPRLVFGLQVKHGRLVVYNTATDKMPIKIAGNKTLEECIVEETEDYVIYSDGQVVTVANYVTGTYDEYNSRIRLYAEEQEKPRSRSKRSLESSLPMLYVTETPTIDHARLLNEINEEKYQELISRPSTLEEPMNGEEVYVRSKRSLVEPLQLASRAIPIPVDFCCRVDKKTGEIYINEGYENHLSTFSMSSNYDTDYSLDNNVLILNKNENTKRKRYVILKDVLSTSAVTFSFLCNNENDIFSNVGMLTAGGDWGTREVGKDKIKEKEGILYVNTFGTADGSSGTCKWVDFDIISNASKNILVWKMQLTKGLKMLPFVETQMPSGKMSILTNATSETHSFVMKNMKYNRSSAVAEKEQYHPLVKLTSTSGLGVEYTAVLPKTVEDDTSFILNNSIAKILNKTQPITDVGVVNRGVSSPETSITYKNRTNSFRQFLIYKGNLTETELKAENDKNIVLSDNRNISLELPANGNPISMLGLENFYGGCWQFVDGFYVKDDGYYIAKFPSQYGDIAKHVHYPATPVMGSTDNQNLDFYFKNIEKIGLYNIPQSTGGNGNGFYTDYFWTHKKGQQNEPLFGGHWYDVLRSGVFCLGINSFASYLNPAVSSRLIYLP